MINFTPIASGSSGNCSIVNNKDTIGVIDIGIPWKRIQKSMEFKTSEIDFVLSGHRHLDHSGYLKDAIKAAIDCYAIQDVWDSNAINSHRAHVIIPRVQFTVKTLKILPFEIPHDVPNVGFLIKDMIDGEKMVYLADCNYCPVRFKGLTIVAIGVNFDNDILMDNITCGHIDPGLGKRIFKNHLSLRTAKVFFQANDMSQVREIYLLHLSDMNSDAEKFKREIEGMTGKPVSV